MLSTLLTDSAESATPHASGPWEVAALSDHRIAQLTRDQLIEVVRASRHPWSPDNLDERLRFADDATLRRMAFLARQCCEVQGESVRPTQFTSDRHRNSEQQRASSMSS